MNNPEPVIPAGWRLVPIEPTEEMRFCGKEWICNDYLVSQCYRAMLAAAPPLPAPPGSAAEGERSQAARDVLAERRRQIEAEGWTPEHDDEHVYGDIAIAAACLAVSGTDAQVIEDDESRDVWGLCVKHADDRRRQLVISGALILAEIERLDRGAGLASISEPQAEPKPQEGNHG